MSLYSPPRPSEDQALARLCARALNSAISLLGGREAAEKKLRAILEEKIWAELGDLWQRESAPIPNLSASDELVERELREAAGVFFTPREVALGMARLGAATEPQHVCDPSCGAGELLLAAGEVIGPKRLTGIEWNPFLALVAAIRLAHAGFDARIIWADALDQQPDGVDLVVSNPPYVGEKGRKELFDSIRAKHPNLAERFSARMDLAYLFMHHTLDIAPAAVLLTSEYWLTAESARALRARLGGREPLTFTRLGRGVFESARGHHSLISCVGFEPRSVAEIGSVNKGGEEPWFPFSESEIDDYSKFPTVGEHLRDYQGFVSGLDRATARHKELDDGTPVFVAERDEISESARSGAGWWRPLIRARDCMANEIILESPSRDYVRWLDDEIESEEPLEGLMPARERLSQRREVREGRMPWYRIHWPRRRQDQVGPKLVVPRRSREALFCLDLSASHISSDCTYLLAPRDVAEPIAYLVRAMLSLNSLETSEYLENFAKRKGEIIEFYSAPLKRLPLFAEVDGGELSLLDPELEARASEILCELRE